MAQSGIQLVVGGDGAGDVTGLEAAIGMTAVHAAQAGLLADMDRVADVLYGREA